ncbi:sensor histidine kinase [Algoriphagus winogradskyi]|uniref:histidine kinase n=1 Tax=Algoriphagus winogradskyi TaxID=237017 RepID=A0ABY1P9U3_9BACT|nr:HAMP domain-containing sensor histidine kinase [Algoriphagus winogradskyi]SMP29723.1 Signal transduction histidine kinase [Algoriphagus winogradskyi]
MSLIDKIKNKYISLPVAILKILFIGYIDYITGDEFGFSFFYLLPIAALSISPKANVSAIIFCSTLASIEWFVSEYLTREYTLLFFPVWNAVVRLAFFISVGLLLYYLKANEQKLKSLNGHLKAINNEKNKFIGIAAHDIKGPLGIIHAFSEILIDDYKEEFNSEVTEILNIIKTTSSNSITVVRNLLDVSKIEAGQLSLTYKTQDYISFITNQVHINQILAKNKDIDISLEVEKDQLFSDFDEHYLSEVIGNFLSNAVKYSNRNTAVLVKVSVTKTHELLTEVIDNGIGISEPEQQNLFNYFQKTSSRPTEGEESTGLGLAISRQIIRLHQGQIGVKSSKNNGSNFFFSIPLKKPIS